MSRTTEPTFPTIDWSVTALPSELPLGPAERRCRIRIIAGLADSSQAILGTTTQIRMPGCADGLPFSQWGCEMTGDVDDEFVIDLPDDLDAPRIARAFLARHAGALDPAIVYDAELLVSELVTNALRHGLPQITLRLRLHPPGIGVSVHDFGPGVPIAPAGEPDLTSEGGRGLYIVAALAAEWGIERSTSGAGKTVWFRLGGTVSGSGTSGPA